MAAQGVRAPARPPRAKAQADVALYARELQEFARQLESAESSEWRAVVNRGLSAAYSKRDALGLAAMVQVIVGFLDASGRFDSAVAEVDGALALARGDHSARAILCAMRASFLAVLGRTTESLAAVGESEAAAAQAQDLPARAKAQAMVVAAKLLLLQPVASDEVERLLALDEPLVDADRLYLLSTYIPYRFATGATAGLHPWIRSFRLEATDARHLYRLSDASVFEEAEQIIRSPLRAPSGESVRSDNSLATWRVHSLSLRAAILRRDFPAAVDEVSRLAELSDRAGTTWSGGIDPFAAVVAAHAGPAEVVDIAPPHTLHLALLASALAGAEAAGLAGTQAQATRWLQWFNGVLPAEVVSAAEWPVSRFRIEGVVAFRAGDIRRARRTLERAIDWSDQAGYAAEKALSQLQLAELLRRHAGGPQERVWTSLRNAGWEELRRLGVDPAPHAYAIAGAPQGTDPVRMLEQLTPRETEVLVLLADGLRYKDIATRLGIKWPTVQSLAHRCYEKLDASGRARAVRAARELGIL